MANVTTLPVSGKYRQPDRSEAQKFLALLDPSTDTFTFSTFPDAKDNLKVNARAKSITGFLYGTLDEHWDELCRRNDLGAGIFVMVNRGDNHGAKNENVVAVRAVWQEADRGDEPQLPLKPNMVVGTSPGKHHAYLLAKDAPLDEFPGVQLRLVRDYGSDPSAKDLRRVLRLPGFYHLKNPADPHLVRIVEDSGAPPYSWDEVKAALPPVERRPGRPDALPREIGPMKREDALRAREALETLDPNMHYNDWLRVGMALHSTGGSQEALDLWDTWSAKGKEYKPDDCTVRWKTFSVDGGITLEWLFDLARKNGWTEPLGDAPPAPEAATGEGKAATGEGSGRKPGGSKRLRSFWAYPPTNAFIEDGTGMMWGEKGINAHIPPVRLGPNSSIKAAPWLSRHRAVFQMVWAPGKPKIIYDERFSVSGDWEPCEDHRVYNTYRAPVAKEGSPGRATPWLDHLKRTYPDDWEHILNWFAHRVQRPAEKINHAVVLGGSPGIGKDTLIEPLVIGVGPHNCHEISPGEIFGKFNPFILSVVLRVSEARDLGDTDRYKFYEHSKRYTAAPPTHLMVNEKYKPTYHALNVAGVLYTTNHAVDCLYLPADDRRHYVAWSNCRQGDFPEDYFSELWDWYNRGGIHDVAALLRTHDLSGFAPKAKPRLTDAFHRIVNANTSVPGSDLGELLDLLRRPSVVLLDRLVVEAQRRNLHELAEKLRRGRRGAATMLMRERYEPFFRSGADNRWSVEGKKRRAYARVGSSQREREAGIQFQANILAIEGENEF